MKLFIGAGLGIVVPVLVGLRAGRRLGEGPAEDPGTQANARLIGYASVVLVIPLVAEVVTGFGQGFLPHALIGFLLVPPLLLKLGSVGYRFVRYYAGNLQYRAAGPPELVMRVLGPALVLLTVGLFATGIELWLFGLHFGNQWMTWHKVAFVIWFLAVTVHVVAYRWRAPELVVADSRTRLRGAVARRSLVVASLLLGAVLVIAMLPFSSPFATPLGGA